MIETSWKPQGWECVGGDYQKQDVVTQYIIWLCFEQKLGAMFKFHLLRSIHVQHTGNIFIVTDIT